jgi:hypothetical protein
MNSRGSYAEESVSVSSETLDVCVPKSLEMAGLAGVTVCTLLPTPGVDDGQVESVQGVSGNGEDNSELSRAAVVSRTLRA